MIDDPHNGGSEPGSWQRELRYPCTYRQVSEYPSELTPAFALGNCGATLANPLVAPVLSDLLHIQG